MPHTKYCFLKSCENNSVVAPGKQFFTVPLSNKAEWCLAAGLDNVPTRALFICEDHLDLEEDMDNFLYWKTMKGRARLKPRLPIFRPSLQEEEAVNRIMFMPSMSNTASILRSVQYRPQAVADAKYTANGESNNKLFIESKQDAEPDPTLEVGLTSFCHLDSPGTTDSSYLRDPLQKTIEQCRFCGDFSKECVVVSSQPYVVGDTTTLSLNDMSVQLDFNTLPNTICEECDKKLTEFSEFVKLVKTTQDSLIYVVKSEPEEIADDALSNVEDAVCNIEYVKTEIPDDADITEIDAVIKTEKEDNESDKELDFSTYDKPIVIKRPKRKVIDIRQANVTKKVKHVTVACEDKEYVDAKADIEGTSTTPRSSEVSESDICTARIFSKKKIVRMENVLVFSK